MDALLGGRRAMRRLLPRATVDDEWTCFDIQLCQPAGSSLQQVPGRKPTRAICLSQSSMDRAQKGTYSLSTLLSIHIASLPRGVELVWVGLFSPPKNFDSAAN